MGTTTTTAATNEANGARSMKILDALVGVNSELINKPECWRDRIKYRAIAFSMVCTAILSFISGTFAIATFTPSLFVAVPLGVLWTAIITGIDRYTIVTTNNNADGSSSNRIRSLVSKGLIGLCSSIVISEPTNLYIFREEIQAEIALMQRETRKALETETSGNLKRLEEEQNSLKQELARLESLRSRQVEAALSEAEGIAGSGLAGKGNLYREKSAEADRTSALIEEKRLTLSQIEDDIQTERTEQKEEIEALQKINPDSLLTQIHALNELKSRDLVINAAATFISLFFLVLDFAPVLAKISARPGVYDALVEAEELTTTRATQLQVRLTSETQDADLRAHHENMESVRSVYHKKVQDTMLNLLEQAALSEEFQAAQKTVLGKVLGTFQEHMESLISDAIKPICASRLPSLLWHHRFQHIAHNCLSIS